MKDKLFMEKYIDDDSFNEQNCLPPPNKDNEQDFGGIYKKYNRNSIQSNYAKFCKSASGLGPQEQGERWRAGLQAAGSGILGLYGFSEIANKTANFIFGGSSEFQNMPQEILNAQVKALDDAKDSALYRTVCEAGKIDIKLLKLSKKLDVTVSTEIDALKQQVQFKIMELGIGQITLGLLIISIVIFLLLY